MIPAKTIEVSKVFYAFMAMTTNIRIFQGSTRSTKTYSILFCLIYLAMNKAGLSIRVFRAVKADCRDTVAHDFLEILEDYFPTLGGIWYESKMKYVFPNGAVIYFAGCDNEKRLHGYKQDIAYINEVMEVNYYCYNQILPRTFKMMIMDFNPSITKHWVFEKVMGKSKDSYEFHHSTYKDNDFLSDFQRANIEAWEPTPANRAAGTDDHWQWQVYGLGQACQAPGAVYKNWKKTDFFPEKQACSHWMYGMDFGFSVDPTTLILVAICQQEMYLKEIFYQKGISTMRNEKYPDNPCIQNLLEFHEIDKTATIVCDKARPEQIHDLKLLGYNARRSMGLKIIDGIDKVKKYSLRVLSNSIHLVGELENYRCKEKIKGKKMVNEPIDDHNHCLDPIRYVAEIIDISKAPAEAAELAKRFENFFIKKAIFRRRTYSL